MKMASTDAHVRLAHFNGKVSSCKGLSSGNIFRIDNAEPGYKLDRVTCIKSLHYEKKYCTHNNAITSKQIWHSSPILFLVCLEPPKSINVIVFIPLSSISW